MYRIVVTYVEPKMGVKGFNMFRENKETAIALAMNSLPYPDVAKVEVFDQEAELILQKENNHAF